MILTAAMSVGVYTDFWGRKFWGNFFQMAITPVLEGLERSKWAQTKGNELNFYLKNVLPLPDGDDPFENQVQN